MVLNEEVVKQFGRGICTSNKVRIEITDVFTKNFNRLPRTALKNSIFQCCSGTKMSTRHSKTTIPQPFEKHVAGTEHIVQSFGDR